jgi:hypothetical protein
MMKAAIIGLVRGYDKIEHYRKLIRRNRLMHRNFNRRFGYPVILFHEGNIHSDHQQILSKMTPHLCFVDISDQAFVEPPRLLSSWRNQIGYKHMCRFYTLQIYDYIKEYDYVLRLDDDSYIQSPIHFDLFKFMRNNSLDYGYIHSEMDSHEETVATLPKFTRQYIREHRSVVPHCSLSDINALYYYTNFTITRVSFWFQPEVQDYLRAVDQSLGIYQYRWGDHIIQTHALKMFSQPERLHHFQDFKYMHGSHEWKNYQPSNFRMMMRKLTKRLRRKLQSSYLNYLLYRVRRS